MKCKCGVELFNKDVVQQETKGCMGTGSFACVFIYRCPKCFKVKTEVLK